MAFEKAVKRLNALEKDPKISGVLDVFNWTFGEISKSDQGISKDQMTSYTFSALKKSADSLLKIFELSKDTLHEVTGETAEEIKTLKKEIEELADKLSEIDRLYGENLAKQAEKDKIEAEIKEKETVALTDYETELKKEREKLKKAEENIESIKNEIAKMAEKTKKAQQESEELHKKLSDIQKEKAEFEERIEENKKAEAQLEEYKGKYGSVQKLESQIEQHQKELADLSERAKVYGEYFDALKEQALSKDDIVKNSGTDAESFEDISETVDGEIHSARQTLTKLKNFFAKIIPICEGRSREKKDE